MNFFEGSFLSLCADKNVRYSSCRPEAFQNAPNNGPNNFGSDIFWGYRPPSSPPSSQLVNAGVDGSRHVCCSENPIQHLILNDRMVIHISAGKDHIFLLFS